MYNCRIGGQWWKDAAGHNAIADDILLGLVGGEVHGERDCDRRGPKGLFRRVDALISRHIPKKISFPRVLDAEQLELQLLVAVLNLGVWRQPGGNVDDRLRRRRCPVTQSRNPVNR